MALGVVCGVVLHVFTYAGHIDHGEWHNGIMLVRFDIDWDTHWMWIVPIGLLFAAGVSCLIFPNYPAIPENDAVRLHDSLLRGYGPEDDGLYDDVLK